MELLAEDAVGVCDGDCRLCPLVLEELSSELVVELAPEPPEETVEAVPEALACWEWYSCSAMAATDPVKPTAPTIIQFVAVEASLRPAARRLKSRLFIVTQVFTTLAREH